MKNSNKLLMSAVLFIIACSHAQQFPQGEHTLNVKQQLKACPDSPNCINTEYPAKTSHYLPPVVYDATKTDQVMAMSRKTILAMGGDIVKQQENYLAATFTSMVFRFVDDFEVRNDVKNHILHIRSASRTGYSDFGVNKKRVKEFVKQFNSPKKGP
ncbi:MAG: DUF1499 domain-containing protein [Thiotrichaceae bacterium]|nr:DUF1499 domain-containing protein [Thiotrichaceae bacterium]